MDEELISQDDCECDCHVIAGVCHVVACCDGLPVDFWEQEYDDPIEQSRQPSSRPHVRSSNYEEPAEWMSFIHSKTTGKPLRGPGSDSLVD